MDWGSCNGECSFSFSGEKIPQIFAAFAKLKTPRGVSSLVGRLEHMKNFRGNDWHTLSLQLPVVLYKLKIGIATPWFNSLIDHLKYYRIMWKKKITLNNIDQFKKYYVQHHKNYYQLYPEDFFYMRETKDGNKQTSKNKINFHLTNHIPTFIQIFGAPTYFSLEVFEHCIKYFKKAHKSTNGKNPTEQVPQIVFELFLGIYCNQTYKEFTKKSSKQKLKAQTKKVNDSICNMGEDWYHFNSITIGNSKYQIGDTVQLKTTHMAIVKGIWGDKEGTPSAKIKIVYLSPTQRFPPISIWCELQLTLEAELIFPSEIRGKNYMFVHKGGYICDPEYFIN